MTDETEQTWPKTIKFYLHASKEDNYDKGKELGLTGQALDDFMYCCYELEVTLVIEQDGSTIMTHVDGTELKRSIGVV